MCKHLRHPALVGIFLHLFINAPARSGGLDTLDWFAEPAGQRIVNQPEVVGVIRDSINLEVTQTFTANYSGAISAIGIALGGAAGTPSLTASLHRVSNSVVQASAFVTSTQPGEYFANIGPQTVPVWVYVEFSSLVPVSAGEQIACRIRSPRAELWGPWRDVLPGGELVEIPGTDLAFRVYMPSLSLVNVGTNLVLGWPSSVTDGAVEVSASLGASMSWATAHSITAATNQFCVPLEPGARFFRLRIP
jgi:hypothetical protein